MKNIISYFLLTVISLAACQNDIQQKDITTQKNTTMATTDFTTSILGGPNPGKKYSMPSLIRADAGRKKLKAARKN